MIDSLTARVLNVAMVFTCGIWQSVIDVDTFVVCVECVYFVLDTLEVIRSAQANESNESMLGVYFIFFFLLVQIFMMIDKFGAYV